MESDKMTVLDAVQTLRGMAASLQVDNGGYKLKLLTIADWIENTYASLLTSKAITLHQPPMPDSEMIRRQDEIIEALQHDLGLLREGLARTRRDRSEREEEV
jgi:hypothetical protein